MMPKKKVKIAVEGCGHGELSAIYSAVPQDTELLIICGDFQAIRNNTDLQGINVPSKYKRLGDFHQYYKGEKKAPILTIFIGGNHENSSYLTELKFGGWVAPNIYYLGEFGAVWFKGLKIGGISGIYNGFSFSRNEIHDAHLPYTDKTIRSVYHVSPKIFTKLYMMENDLDIVISHDWPSQIEKHGDVKLLLKKKPFFKADIANNKLGSPLNQTLLHTLKPRYWFSAHLHVKFKATVIHNQSNNSSQSVLVDGSNPDEIELNMDDDFEIEERSEESESSDSKRKFETESDSGKLSKRIKLDKEIQTHFLALDKCLPGRAFLECMEISVLSDHPSIGTEGLYYDKRAIAVNKILESFIASETDGWLQIKPKEFYNLETLSHYKELRMMIDRAAKDFSTADMKIPENFKVVCPTSDAETNMALRYWKNDQTVEYCNKFNVPYTPPV